MNLKTSIARFCEKVGMSRKNYYKGHWKRSAWRVDADLIEELVRAERAARLKNLDRDTPMLMPPDLRDWVPDDHIVHFIIDAADLLPCEYFLLNHRGTGDEQYSPRVIEHATESDVAVRYICGDRRTQRQATAQPRTLKHS